VIPGKVYQAIAYALGYPAVIVGDNDKLIIIDSPESYQVAVQQLADIRATYPAVGCKPIEAVIVTLFHGDHIWGLKVS
jgi:glyoxylase-like metal-dependent hydrolase (beta-lactamase superfamily II)